MPFQIKHRLWLLPGIVYPLVSFLSCSYSNKAARKLYAQAAQKKYDVIIVPGVPFENGSWSRTMKGRVYWSKYLYEQGVAKNIIYSGSAVYSPYCEAEIMALYATALGIPREHIFTETHAQHSTENLYYSYQQAKKLGFKTIALASDPFQTKALRRFARKRVSASLGFIPMVTDTMKKLEPGMVNPSIDQQQAFRPDFVSLVKREGFWKRLRGTLGKNIDTTAVKTP